MIQGISVAAQNDFLRGDGRAAAGAGRRDPEGPGRGQPVSSFIGVDGSNMTLNTGRFLINLKPKDERTLNATEIGRRLQQETASVTGITLYLQPVQDLTIDAAVSRTQYQFVLENPNQRRSTTGCRSWSRELQQVARSDRRRERPAAAGADAEPGDRPRDRGALRHHARHGRQRAVRPVRPAYHLHHLHAVEPVSRDHGGRSARCRPRWPRCRAIYLPSSAVHHRAGAADGDRARRAEAGPLQISIWRSFRRRRSRSTPRPGSSLGAAVTAIRQAEKDIGLPDSFVTAFQGAAAALQASLSNELLLVLAAIVTVYIVLGVLYESFIHPDHHPLDAAIGRRRRAAGAADRRRARST